MTEIHTPLDLSTPGLSGREAASRLAKFGPNELSTNRRRSLFSLLLSVLVEPMLLLLVAIGLVYLLLGDPQEALILSAAVFAVIGLTVWQERRTERALDALRDLSSPRALVIRDDVPVRIAGREVVPGDLVVLSEGDRVPADGVLLAAFTLQVDESLLTGESMPVGKATGRATDQMERPGGEKSAFVYAGSLVVRGHGVELVLSTGQQTEMGWIGRSLQLVATGSTLLERSIRRLVRTFAVVGLGLCVMASLAYGALRGNWLAGVLAGLTMAISLVPEEFPVVISVFLALGAWRIARKHVLTRRLAAIETLGAATVLCVDKTGTLTENRMAVQVVATGARQYHLADLSACPDQPWHEVISVAALACSAVSVDPMEVAIRAAHKDARIDVDPAHGILLREYGIAPNLLAMSCVWERRSEPACTVATKGAPEAVATLCDLPADARGRLMAQVEELARQGLRVLAVATGTVSREALPPSQTGLALRLIGLIGLADPVRASVPDSVAECYGAGIRVVMVTGDYAETARGIARQIGLRSPDHIISGPELVALSDSELAERARTVNVFARVMPEQKLRLVQALKADGEVVAMTGDGVNDAPALKAAHIGIAMGRHGTDVAREAADLVLLDDDFTSIVHAVRLGRRIYDNLRHAMSYIIAIHVPLAGMSLIPVLAGWPLVLLPAHIAFLELIIDPACAVVFEAQPEAAGLMQRPPRHCDEPLFSRAAIVGSLISGAIALSAVLAVFVMSHARTGSVTDARAITFTTLVLANLALIVSNHSWSHTRTTHGTASSQPLRLLIGTALLALAAVLYVDPLRQRFHFSRLHLDDLAVSLTAGILVVAVLEAAKRIRPKQPGRPPRAAHFG